MKYLDYNLVELEFTQEATSRFFTKNYTKDEFDAILSRLKKSNILIAKVTFQQGDPINSVGCIQGYQANGNPIYSFTSGSSKYTLSLSTVNDSTGITKYRFQLYATSV